MYSSNCGPHRRIPFVLGGLLALACVLLVSAGLPSTAWAAELQVSNTNDSGAGSLRQAITDAASGDTINFNLPEGSTITLTSGQLAVNKNLTIKGSGATSLSISGNNQSRVFSVGAGSSVDISGLTIKNGRVTGTNGSTGSRGGGTVQAGSGQGGGIYNAGTLDLSAVAVAANTTTGGRGADNAIQNSGDLYAAGAPGGSGQGGGIYNTGTGTLSVSKSSFSGNQAVGGAGGNGDGGGGAGGSGDGGAILNAGTMSVAASTLDDNRASGGAGGTGSPDFRGGNGGSGSGGGVSNLSGTTSLTGVTTSANQAAGGSGGSGSSSGSNGRAFGGGLYNNTGNSFSVSASIVALNTTSWSGPDVYGSFTSTGYNLIGKSDGGSGFGSTGDQAGTEAAPLDPKLGPLQDNGGPTDTRALQAGSPALDKGKSFGLTADQRGEARPQDDSQIANASGGDGSDIGAFELDVAPPPDSEPPGAVAGFAAKPGDKRVDLSWTNPADGDFASVRVLRSETGGGGSGPEGGCVETGDLDNPYECWSKIYEGADTSYTDVGTTRAPLTNGKRYYYKAYARDKAGNWSSSVSTNAVPTGPPLDSTAPTVSLTAPSDGSTVSGSNVTLSADATDDTGVSRVDFYVGATKVGSDTTGGGIDGKEYSYSWDSTPVSDSSQKTITAYAYDAANNEKISSSRTVTVVNTTADTTKPTVSLTAPSDGSTVSGSNVTLSADATDDTGVSRVDFYVGTAKVGSDTTGGGTDGKEYSASWDSTSVLDGSQKTITAHAYDAANNEKISSSRTITVDNSSGGDTQAPTVYSSNPVPNKTGVRRGANLSVTFSEAMKAGTLNSSNVALYKNGTGSAIPATATPNAAGTSVTLDPSARLASKTQYMVVLWRDSAETGVQDDARNLIDGSGSYTLSEDGKYVYYWFKTGRK